MGLKDWIGIVIAAAGWALAAWQYWRNELNRRPLVLLEPEFSTQTPGRINAKVVVRNRGPWDLYVNRIRLLDPKAVLSIDIGGPILLITGAGYGDRPTSTGRDLPIDMRLPAHSSGEFPTDEFWFWIDDASALTHRVCIELMISRNKDASRSASFKRCQSIHTNNK